MSERIFHVDDDNKNFAAMIEFGKACEQYIPYLYEQIRPIIGHDGPFTREEYDDAIMRLVWGGDAEAMIAEMDYNLYKIPNSERNFWIDMQPPEDRRIVWTEKGTDLDDELCDSAETDPGRYLPISESTAYTAAKSGYYYTAIIKPHGLTPDWTDDVITQYMDTDDGVLYY